MGATCIQSVGVHCIYHFGHPGPKAIGINVQGQFRKNLGGGHWLPGAIYVIRACPTCPYMTLTEGGSNHDFMYFMTVWVRTCV